MNWGFKMNKQTVIEMIEALGWDNIPCKNEYMVSFMKRKDYPTRLNVYFTSGTIQIQKEDFQKIHRNCTLEEIEQIITTY